MPSEDNGLVSSAADLVRRFYAAREEGDPQLLRSFLKPDVRWTEPVVGTHMGALEGADAVLDMIRRAQATTGGTFSLTVTQTIETANTCAAVVAWTADKDGRRITGRELAVFEVADGLIAGATFHAERLADDDAFWA